MRSGKCAVGPLEGARTSSHDKTLVRGDVRSDLVKALSNDEQDGASYRSRKRLLDLAGLPGFQDG